MPAAAGAQTAVQTPTSTPPSATPPSATPPPATGASPHRPAAAPTDPALTALIPDSALADPVRWALDTDAAHQPAGSQTLPDVTWLNQPDGMPLADAALGPIAGLTIAWPDTFALPPIVPLTPDPDMAAIAGAARDAGAKLDVAMPRGGWRGPLGGDAVVHHVAPGIDLVLPGGTVLPELGAIASRFAELSALRALGRGDDNLAQLTRRARDDTALLQQILHLYGYYDADISQNLIGVLTTSDTPAPVAKAHGAPLPQATVRFEVVPGTRYRLGTIDLGDVAHSPDRAALIAALALKTGDPAQTEAILAGRARLYDTLTHIGHAFAKVGDPALDVDHATLMANLTVPVTTGGVYVFGAIASSLPRMINAHHLQRIARFRPGRTYDQRLVDDFRRAVLSTGFVGGVTIAPREAVAPTATSPGVADLDVKLTKGPEHTIGAAIGLSNGEGFEVDGSWEDRNLFPPEGMLRLRGIVGTRQQLAGVTFRRSNFMARDQALNLDLYAQSLNTDAYDARTLSAIMSLDKQSTLLFQKRWAYSLGVQVIATKQLTAGSAPGTPFVPYFIAALPLKLGFDGSNNLLDPTRGLRITATVSPAISIQDGPRSSYVTTQLDVSAYQPVSASVVMAERVRVAAINGTGIANIAPSQRLYAGGGASVRGYGYQDVGPRDASNNPTGGLSLTEFSLEARVRTGLFDGALGIVPFVDAGMVGTTPTPTMRGAKFGAGLGVRYKTNFGPIRIDLGTPINPSPHDSRIGVYVSLGQAF